MVSEPYQDDEVMAVHQVMGRDVSDGREMEEATTALKMLSTDPEATDVEAVAISNECLEEVVLEAEILETWTVPPLLPFLAEEVKLPVLSEGSNVPIPIKFTGHFPSNGKFSNEDKDRLSAFYQREDLETYLLQKNKFRDRNKYYLRVKDALSLKPGTFVRDGVLNFVWNQFAEQSMSRQHGELRVGYFPSFFLTTLVDSTSKENDGYQYSQVTNWSQTYLGRGTSPLEYDVILFLRNETMLHWFSYAIFPKSHQMSGFDSMGDNDYFEKDIQYLWRWLNDDLRVHWHLQAPLPIEEWTFTNNRKEQPKQSNGFDCGLYAIHIGFALGLQAPMKEVTKKRVNKFRQKLILYILDGNPTRDILLPKYQWYEEFMVESIFFKDECHRLHGYGIPQNLFDVLGDGNCLFYCMLIFLVKHKLLPHLWKEDCSPVVWMRKQIRMRSELLESDEWVRWTFQANPEHVQEELARIYDPTIDYLGDQMRSSDEYHGSIMDCYTFAKLYSVIVVLYVGDEIPIINQTLVFDGRQSSEGDTSEMKQGIHPYALSSGLPVFELVRYKTDVEKKRRTTAKGKKLKRPVPYVALAAGPGHFIGVNRSGPPMTTLAATTRSQSKSPDKGTNKNKEDKAVSRGDGGDDNERKRDESKSAGDQGGNGEDPAGNGEEENNEEDKEDKDEAKEKEAEDTEEEDITKEDSEDEEQVEEVADLKADVNKEDDDRAKDTEEVKEASGEGDNSDNLPSAAAENNDPDDHPTPGVPAAASIPPPTPGNTRDNSDDLPSAAAGNNDPDDHPTPGVPAAASIPPPTPGNTEDSREDPPILEDPGDKEKRKKRNSRIQKAAAENETRRQEVLKSSKKKKPKPRESRLSSQEDVEDMFDFLDYKDNCRKEKSEQRRKDDLNENTKAQARFGMTADDIKKKKKELQRIRKEEKNKHKEYVAWIENIYLPCPRKGGGTTRFRAQRTLLDERFPDPTAGLTEEEKTALKEEYEDYKNGLEEEDRKEWESTNNSVNQICALMYTPRDPTPTRNYKYGIVAHFSAKAMGGTKNRHQEQTLPYALTVEWVRWCFKPEYVTLVMREWKRWHRVVIGNTRTHADMAPKYMRTQVPVAYPQGDHDRCLFLGLASALHYMGLIDEAAKLAEMASKAEHLPGTKGIEALKAAMIECAPCIGRPYVFNKRKRKPRSRLTVEEVTSVYSQYPTVVIPLGTDGSVSHAICVVDDLIFDATQWCALKCKVDSIGWICDSGSKGVAGVYEAFRFQNSMNCKPLDREIVRNWTP